MRQQPFVVGCPAASLPDRPGPDAPRARYPSGYRALVPRLLGSGVRRLLLLLRVLLGLLARVRQRLRDVVQLRLRGRPVAALELLRVRALPRDTLDLRVQVLHRRADLVRLLLQRLAQPAQLLDVRAPHTRHVGSPSLLDGHPAWPSRQFVLVVLNHRPPSTVDGEASP